MTLQEYYEAIENFSLLAIDYSLDDYIEKVLRYLRDKSQLRKNTHRIEVIKDISITLDRTLSEIVGLINEIKEQLELTGTINPFIERLMEAEMQQNILVGAKEGFVSKWFAGNNEEFESIVSTLKEILKPIEFYETVSERVNELGLETSFVSTKDTLVLIFTEDAFFDDLKGLKDASDEWGFIVNSFGRLVNENSVKAEVLSVERGSLLITLGVVMVIIRAITKCSNQISEARINILKVTEKILELKKLTISTSSEELDLIAKRETQEIEKLTRKITINLLETYQREKSEDYHEIEGFFSKSVEKMITFRFQGGNIEPRLISPSEQDKKELEELKKLNAEIEQKKEEINNLLSGKTTELLGEGEE